MGESLTFSLLIFNKKSYQARTKDYSGHCIKSINFVQKKTLTKNDKRIKNHTSKVSDGKSIENTKSNL